MMNDRNTAHRFVGDLYQDGESREDLMGRIRERLKAAFPGMKAKTRWEYGSGFTALMVSITEYRDADLSIREEGHAARRLVCEELYRFTRHDWDPVLGIRNQSTSVLVDIDPSLHAAALRRVPDVEPRVSFVEFTRRARPGDVLEHLDGEVPTQGRRVEIVSVSARRLTTRPAEPTQDARPSRHPIQGGACFVSDGERVCFKHSGFASQGGYSLMRWIPAA